MAPRKPNIRSKKRKFKKTSPPPRLSTAQIRRLTVDGEAVTDTPFVPDVLRSGRFKNVELGMKDMPAGYEEGGGVGKKKVDITKMSLEELDRYIEQLKEPLMVKPVKKNNGGEAKKGVLRNVIDQFGNRRKFLRSDEGKAEKKARKLHNERMGPTDKDAKRKLRRDAKKADAAKGALMLNKGGGLNAAIERVKKVQGMEDGGEVPKKFKGFSKLPEDVQQQMNPTLAAKYEDGGEVRGMIVTGKH